MGPIIAVILDSITIVYCIIIVVVVNVYQLVFCEDFLVPFSIAVQNLICLKMGDNNLTFGLMHHVVIHTFSASKCTTIYISEFTTTGQTRREE